MAVICTLSTAMRVSIFDSVGVSAAGSLSTALATPTTATKSESNRYFLKSCAIECKDNKKVESGEWRVERFFERNQKDKNSGCSIWVKIYHISAYRTISTLPPSFLVQRLHNNLTAAVITAHRSEVSSFI